MNKLRFTISIALLVFQSIASAQQMPPTLVVTEKVERLDFHDQITLVGRTEALFQSRVVSKVSAQVVSISALEGNRLSKGDALVQLDTTRIALSYKAKTAEANQAKIRAALVTKIAKRAEDLYIKKMLSDLAIDSARAMAAIANEKYNQLQSEQERLAHDLADCTIRAPFSGYTGNQLTAVGEWVEEGSPVFEMTQLSKIKINLDLPERYFGHLRTGTQVTIYTSAKESTPMTGIVTGIAPNATSATHTFPVIVAVDNSQGRLGAGMLVRATLSLNKTFSSLAVSKDAIVRQGNQTMIYTINEGKAASISVSTSSTKGQKIAVEGPGLTEGMTVVVRGNERIFPGSPVKTSDGPPPQSAPENGQQEDDS
ncbi:MAG: efflux RND transporter periplasmic adaptor subunit [candidate division Zixibacteria bacterium]|nr:efflux RND transporter periplasmic adaptor subunit [candidate division Zixibacteria bacterium]